MQQSFRWQKLGMVHRVPQDGSWRHMFAQAPTPIHLGDRIRVFLSVRPPRDASGNCLSTISWVDVDPADPTRVIGEAATPVLPWGRRGTFDEFGIMSTVVVRAGEALRLYYAGWMRMVGVPYDWAVGLAESRDGGATFSKVSEGPLFGRSPEDPFNAGSAHVLFHGGTWHMWYASGIGWVEAEGRQESIYVLKHAVSSDGIRWERDGRRILPPLMENECQARPSVMRLGNRWHMWFTYRHGTDFRNPERGYRLGHAWSDDLAAWHRDDAAGGLDRSATGWDSEMICYPALFEANGGVYMYYNGNAFGALGFGCARLMR